MLNPLGLITVTADNTGRSLLFRFFGSTQLSSTSESTVELNYLGRPKQVLGSAHVKFDVSREALAVNRYNDEQMESMTAGKTTSTLTKNLSIYH